MDASEKASLTFAGLALVVSVCSFYLAFGADRRSRQDVLVIQSEFAPEMIDIAELAAVGTTGGVARLSWRVTLANVGQSTASVLDYELDLIGGGTIRIPPGLDGGMVDATGEEVIFPLSLSSGHTLTAWVDAFVPLDYAEARLLRTVLALRPTSFSPAQPRDVDGRSIPVSVGTVVYDSIIGGGEPSDLLFARPRLSMPHVQLVTRTTRGDVDSDTLRVPNTGRAGLRRLPR